MEIIDENAPSPGCIKYMEEVVGKKYGETVAWILWELAYDNPTEEQISDALCVARETM